MVALCVFLVLDGGFVNPGVFVRVLPGGIRILPDVVRLRETARTVVLVLAVAFRGVACAVYACGKAEQGCDGCYPDFFHDISSFVWLCDKSVRLESESFHEFKVLAAVDTRGGEHVVGNGRVRAALEGALAVVAEYATAAREADERLRVDKTVNRHDTAEFVVRELGEVLVRRAGNRVQHVHRCGLDAEFAEVQAHVDAVFHHLAEAHDASATNFEPCGKRILQGSDLVVVGVRGAHVGEVPAVGFQVVVEAGETGFLQLVELFAIQKPRREANGKFSLLFETVDGFADLLHVAVRERASRGDDGVARDACGFFLLRVSHDFVGGEQLVFGCAGVVVAALGAILAVLGASAATGVHDGAEIKVVSVELFTDFVGGGAEFLQVFVQKLDCLFAADFVAAQNFFLEVLNKGQFDAPCASFRA